VQRFQHRPFHSVSGSIWGASGGGPTSRCGLLHEFPVRQATIANTANRLRHVLHLVRPPRLREGENEWLASSTRTQHVHYRWVPNHGVSMSPNCRRLKTLNKVWETADGRTLKMWNVLDEFNRDALAVERGARSTALPLGAGLVEARMITTDWRLDYNAN
jgi:hypothetical protein